LTKSSAANGVENKPAMPINRIKGATDMVRQIGEAIYMLDLTIDQWNEQLKRAQPHRNGRVALIFTPVSRTMIDGKVAYDAGPLVGKMVLMRSGAWRFFRLTEKDKHEKLSDLRVGKSLLSDPLVVRLLDGIEDMLKQRESLCEILAALSRGTPGKVSSILASCSRRADEAIDLSLRVKLDWTKGAEEAEAKIRAQRRERYERERSKKKAQATGLHDPAAN